MEAAADTQLGFVLLCRLLSPPLLFPLIPLFSLFFCRYLLCFFVGSDGGRDGSLKARRRGGGAVPNELSEEGNDLSNDPKQRVQLVMWRRRLPPTLHGSPNNHVFLRIFFKTPLARGAPTTAPSCGGCKRQIRRQFSICHRAATHLTARLLKARFHAILIFGADEDPKGPN